jgi:hypothetical protein
MIFGWFPAGGSLLMSRKDATVVEISTKIMIVGWFPAGGLLLMSRKDATTAQSDALSLIQWSPQVRLS